MGAVLARVKWQKHETAHSLSSSAPLPLCLNGVVLNYAQEEDYFYLLNNPCFNQNQSSSGNILK
jgi:hypothetical protein